MLQVWRLLFFEDSCNGEQKCHSFLTDEPQKRVLSLAWVVAFSSILHGLLIYDMRFIGLFFLVSPPLRIIESELYLTSELNLAQLHPIRDERSDGQKEEMTDSNFSVGQCSPRCEPGLTVTTAILLFPSPSLLSSGHELMIKYDT